MTAHPGKAFIAHQEILVSQEQLQPEPAWIFPRQIEQLIYCFVGITAVSPADIKAALPAVI
ncbi:MAG: hypothetical protein KME26_11675 [Oscillatoria princeps RMCB-10]|nr:hypothetical protein [Oscillatoria princeps RMCB-10]